MDIIIQKASQENVPSILEIINNEIIHSTAVYDYHEKTISQMHKWFEEKQSTGMPVLVAVNQETVLGYGTYGIYRPWDGYQYSVEHSIYVHKDYRSLGVGKLLMADLIALARKEGYHTMIAGVDASNEGSCEFHKKFGFEEIGTFRQVGYKFDQWLDLRFLQLMLK